MGSIATALKRVPVHLMVFSGSIKLYQALCAEEIVVEICRERPGILRVLEAAELSSLICHGWD